MQWLGRKRRSTDVLVQWLVPAFKCGILLKFISRKQAFPGTGSEKRASGHKEKKGLPVVVKPPDPQEEQQDYRDHTDSHHSDVALLPLAGVAQLPPSQVSVLTSLPNIANDTAVDGAETQVNQRPQAPDTYKPDTPRLSSFTFLDSALGACDAS